MSEATGGRCMGFLASEDPFAETVEGLEISMLDPGQVRRNPPIHWGKHSFGIS